MMPRLLVLTDRAQLPEGREIVESIARCVDAGLTHVVLRELDLPRPERAALAGALIDAGAVVIAAHERLPGCAGVHVPSAGTPTAGSWGRSCHSADDVERAKDEGASWVTLSPFATSVSKPGGRPTLSASAFAGHRLPVYALAGIDVGNAADARAAGAHGVAVMGAVMRAVDPARVVSGLLEAVA